MEKSTNLSHGDAVKLNEIRTEVKAGRVENAGFVENLKNLFIIYEKRVRDS